MAKARNKSHGKKESNGKNESNGKKKSHGKEGSQDKKESYGKKGFQGKKGTPVKKESQDKKESRVNKEFQERSLESPAYLFTEPIIRVVNNNKVKAENGLKAKNQNPKRQLSVDFAKSSSSGRWPWKSAKSRCG